MCRPIYAKHYESRLAVDKVRPTAILIRLTFYGSPCKRSLSLTVLCDICTKPDGVNIYKVKQ